MKLGPLWIIFGVLFLGVANAQDKAARTKANPPASKPKFYKIDDDQPEAPTKKPTYIKIDEDEDEAELKAAADSITKSLKTAEEPKEKSWADMGGTSLTGVPRLIRQDPLTEVFFRDLKTSYVIHTDSKHNANYKAFDEAARANRSITFRADPISRRILFVDGVGGVKAPPPPTAPGPTGLGTKSNSK